MLKMVGEVKGRKYLTLDNVEGGNLFTYFNEPEEVYILTEDGAHYINLFTGEYYDVEDEDENKPIILIDAELVIKKTREE